jgi:putative ABC transport system ATP-binding protein
MAMSMLELREVSRSYGQGSAEVHALREVSLTADEGAMVAVMGPSGSGKSTLLTIAGTLEDPTSGEVLIAGRPVSGESRGAKARLRRRVIGYVFQDFNLLPGLTAAENVSLPLELDGVPGRKARIAALKALDRLGACPSAPPITRTRCPAGNDSGSRSRGRWWASAGCCSPTSRPGRWTQ